MVFYGDFQATSSEMQGSIRIVIHAMSAGQNRLGTDGERLSGDLLALLVLGNDSILARLEEQFGRRFSGGENEQIEWDGGFMLRKSDREWSVDSASHHLSLLVFEMVGDEGEGGVVAGVGVGLVAGDEES